MQAALHEEKIIFFFVDVLRGGIIDGIIFES